MSLSTSMNNALSGLAAAARGAQVVSSNVANATTEGYGTRVLELSARHQTGSGQGVRIDGVTRQADESLLAERRLAGASSSQGERLRTAAADIVALIGEPDEPGSLAQGVAAFDAALSLAVSRPDSEVRLNELLVAADGLTRTLNRMSTETQALRVEADANIFDMVGRLNEGLQNLAEINALILRANARGDEVPALLDERQKQIDAISDIIPIRQIERDNGTVALYTPSGTRLLDITPAVFEFTRTPTITADMTLASGALSGLTLDGNPLDVGPNGLAISGGALAAEFAVRDTIAPEAQTRLDALAAELVVRFSDAGLDASIPVGMPGLFTDAGAAYDPTLLDGLAGRLAVNAAVDPARGGALWRLRDGIGAAAPGNAGDASLLGAIRTAFTAADPPIVALPGQGPAGIATMADRLLAAASSDLATRSQTQAFRQARHQTLDEAVRATGVNTDQEMQKLLLIERFYAANAKVIETVDEMLALLTRL